jgi:hypothetical protein
LGGFQFQATRAKKFVSPHLNGKKLGKVVIAVILAMVEAFNRRIAVQAGLGKKARSYLQNN